MVTCFKCGKLIPGKYEPCEYVMCNECVKEWHRAGDIRDIEFTLKLERMLNDVHSRQKVRRPDDQDR